MEHFEIIESLEQAAADRGWKSYFGINNAYINAVRTDSDEVGQLSLVFIFKQTPVWAGSKTDTVEYSGRIMLGRKFDSDGVTASLDEKFKQKYDRRLSELTGVLNNFLIQFKCENDLELISHSGYEYLINMFDANIDFVAVNNIILRQ